MEALAWVIGIVGALFLLFRFPRPSLILVGVLVAIGIIAGGLSYVSETRAAQKIAAVTITAVHTVDICGSEGPLLITIKNGSDDTVEKTSFRVEGYSVGFSEPLYENSGYSTDRIIASGDLWAACWQLPQKARGVSEQRISGVNPAALVWSVRNIRPIFSDR